MMQHAKTLHTQVSTTQQNAALEPWPTSIRIPLSELNYHETDFRDPVFGWSIPVGEWLRAHYGYYFGFSSEYDPNTQTVVVTHIEWHLDERPEEWDDTDYGEEEE